MLIELQLEMDLKPESCLCCDSYNLNQNSLLVKHQIDNPSPGAVTGGN